MGTIFLDEQTAIKSFIEAKLPVYTAQAGLADIEKYIDDDLDFDKYEYNIMLFYNFHEYSFSGLSAGSDKQTEELTIFIVVRGDEDDTKTNLLKYAAAFFQMMKENSGNFGGITDFGKIQTVRFYNAVEGTPHIKLAELTITGESEI